MKRTNLLLVCGLAAAISSPAMAQTGNQPGERQQPGQQPGQDQDRQERQSRLGQQGGQQDASNILKQLEGSWHIEIKMDPQLFGKSSAMGADRTRTPTPGQDRDQTDPTRDRDPTDPMRDRDDPTQPDRTPKPDEQNQRPGQPDRTLGADQQGMVTSRGYSQNRLILNDKVLHEAAVIINSGQEGAAAGQSGSEQIQALTFLGFDDQSKKYSFVIMTDRSGKINCNHGEFDSGQKKITFEKEGRAAMSGMSGQSKLDNVKIVLEIVSNDEHKVTMYDTSASGQSGLRQRQQDEERTPGVDRPGQQPDRAQPGQSPEGKVVYEATYTRADGEQPGQPGQMPGQQRPTRPGQQTPGGGQ